MLVSNSFFSLSFLMATKHTTNMMNGATTKPWPVEAKVPSRPVEESLLSKSLGKSSLSRTTSMKRYEFFRFV
jgi:hypothetical protein